MGESESKTFKFAVDQLKEGGHKLLEFAKNNPAAFGLGTLTIAAGIATVVVPIAVGFSPGGLVAGSLAAAWMSSIGSVTAGSFFAMLQSLTMTGTLLAVGGAMIGVGVVGLLGAETCMKHLEQVARDTDWQRMDPKQLEWLKGEEWLKKTMGEVQKQVENIGQGMIEGSQGMGKQIEEGSQVLGQNIETEGQKTMENVQKGGEEFVSGIQSAFGG